MEELILAEGKKRQLRPAVGKKEKYVLGLVAMGEQRAVIEKMGKSYALGPAGQKKKRALGSEQKKKRALGSTQKKERLVVVVVHFAGQ
jgi:hypothetical protein